MKKLILALALMPMMALSAEAPKKTVLQVVTYVDTEGKDGKPTEEFIAMGLPVKAGHNAAEVQKALETAPKATTMFDFGKMVTGIAGGVVKSGAPRDGGAAIGEGLGGGLMGGLEQLF